MEIMMHHWHHYLIPIVDLFLPCLFDGHAIGALVALITIFI